MNKNRKFEKEMRQFLRDLDAGKPINYHDKFVRHCVYECIKREYVEGYYNAGLSTTGTIIFDISPSPKVRKSGYEFMDKRPDWLAISTAITSALTAIGVILQLVLSHLL